MKNYKKTALLLLFAAFTAQTAHAMELARTCGSHVTEFAKTYGSPTITAAQEFADNNPETIKIIAGTTVATMAFRYVIDKEIALNFLRIFQAQAMPYPVDLTVKN